MVSNKVPKKVYKIEVILTWFDWKYNTNAGPNTELDIVNDMSFINSILL